MEITTVIQSDSEYYEEVENFYNIGSNMCAMSNLTILKIIGCRLSNVVHELGLLSLTELHLNKNAMGSYRDWNWLSGKPLMNSLRTLDLSSNQLKFFPIQLVKYEKLVSLNLKNNKISRLPFGIRRMRALRTFSISNNMLVSLPSTFHDLNLNSKIINVNSFMHRKEKHLLAARKQLPAVSVESQEPIYKTPGGIVSHWVHVAQEICGNNFPTSSSSYGTFPDILVDILLEFPKCICGKLCDDSIVYEYAIFTTLPNYIYQEIALCGKFCTGIFKASQMTRQLLREYYHISEYLEHFMLSFEAIQRFRVRLNSIKISYKNGMKCLREHIRK